MMTSIDRDDKRLSSRREFLQALYAEAPEDLYLELRCIHPATGEVRPLWSPIGNKRQLSSIFKQADALNSEGFGIFFAPCLRREKSGKADSAVLAPAFWIDVDSTTPDNLESLRSFDPAPSYIVSSGGGMHAYWLLETPYQLEDEVSRQTFSTILRGLFTLLDGDPGYAKSPASTMRLPGSVNTKPDRNGALASIIEAHPDQRYPFERFEWLDVQPQPEKAGSLTVVTVNGNGHHPLPPRTEQYLSAGAPNGSRNAELFAAACQMRDAGYSQSEAQHELIPRYVADGGEPSREREAKATIESAYSRPPRDPITDAKARVTALIGGNRERPTAAQIVDTVKACAQLNAVEWAEERQRLKALCGDGLKLSDLDRIYRESKRELKRHQQQTYGENEGYFLKEGCIVYRKETYQGPIEKAVTDWTAEALHQTCRIDDDGRETHVTTIELRRGDTMKQLDVPAEVFVDDLALRRFIGATAGAQYVVRAGMSKHLVPAIVHLSGDFPTYRHYNFMGWMQLEGRWVYVSPQDCITSDGSMEEPPSVELDTRLRDYGLQSTSWEQSLAAFDAVTKVLPPGLAAPLIAFTLLPVVQRFFPAAAPRPALHLVGTSGSGKSEIASLLASFYGRFSRDTPPAQWGDTVNTVEALGYSLADALYWVDDYKSCYADERTFTRFLQSYSRGMGRGRLTREAKLRQERPCRGLLLSTGETTIEGEASILSRMLVLEVPPWERRDPGGKLLIQAEALRHYLPAFTTHFARWIAAQADTGVFPKVLASRFEQNTEGYRQKLVQHLGRQANTGRMIGNWAVLVSVYQLLHQFLTEKDADETLPLWQDAIVETIRAVQEERAGHIFRDLLGQLLAGGQCVIEDDMRHSHDHAPGTTVIGYRDEGFLYLLPDIVLREINKTHPIRFTKTAIGNQLREDGLLIPGKDNLTVQRSVRGHVTRFWRLKSEILGCEGCETCETD